ncbi:MAG: HEAT repeat domain-containing protein [Saprospiraceae bacterium]|nr:HEAT repeat domain-containing protein [Saprospiraceae bacterium]
MTKENWKDLMEKYQRDQLNKEEQKKLDRLIAEGKLSLEDFEDLQKLDSELSHHILVDPPATLDRRFYQSLHKFSTKNTSTVTINRWIIGMAASVLLLIGVGVGTLFNAGSNAKVLQLSGEMKAMREMMMLSMLEQGSPSDRLKAVSLTGTMTEVSDRVSQALLYRVNHDRNDNVRIASIEALRPYSQNPKVREGLIEAIQHQQSPLVLLTLAETLKSIDQQQTLEGFQNQMNKDIPQEVLRELETGLKDVL